MSFKGLIVDFGGVLTTSVFDSFGRFCAEYGVEPARLKEVLSPRAEEVSALHRVETGEMSGFEFNSYLAEALSEGRGSPLVVEGLKDQLFAHVQPEPSMYSALLQARTAGVRTALLSNSWGGDGYPRETFAQLFDVVVLSGEVGMRKPDPPIYMHTCGELGLEPGRCVFVDDLLANVEGAEAVGMKGIHHTSTEETLGRLATFFDLDLA